MPTQGTADDQEDHAVKLGITGASGKYGHQAAKAILSRVAAENLVLITRSPEKLAEFQGYGCAIRKGDFDDPESMGSSLHDVDRLLLISTGRVGSRIPQHARAIEASRTAGVKHIVYTSFVGVDDADNPAIVVKDHRETERLLRSSGMAWTILRDSQYADAMVQGVAPMALGSGTWRSIAGEGRIALVTRDDCVACAVAVMTGGGHENRVYNITGSERLRFHDVAQVLSRCVDRAIDYQDITADELFAMFDAMGVPRSAIDDHSVQGFEWSSEDMVSFEQAIRGGHFDIRSNDVETLLGRPPERFSDFIARHSDALRAMVREEVR
jgi:NAD(P)H dehydrogenase (quinone)